jgi:transposase
MGFIAASREQQVLFGYSLDDFVDERARCRFIAELVSRLDLTDLYADYSTQGGDAFEPSILLATWFLAYSEGVTSTRRVEQLCLRDMHYIYASANLRPDHTTLSRFRQRHLERLPGYFEQIIRLAIREGVSDFKLIGVDGSKLQASSSSRQNRDGVGLERELEKVREQIAEYLLASELLDEEEDTEDVGELEDKIEQLQRWEQKLRERQQQLSERRGTLQSKDRRRHKINLVEPEARNHNGVNGQPAAPGYNTQVSVDAQTQLIVASDVTDEPTDQNQFGRQHSLVEEVLGADPARGYVADAGYHSFDELEYIEEHEVDAVIADPRPEHRRVPEGSRADGGKRFFGRGMFQYDASTDTYRCPAGEVLRYVWHERHRGRRCRVYQGSACVGCSLRSRCLRTRNPRALRRVVRDDKEHLAERMLQRVQSPEGRRRLDLRRMSNEPVIGNLKSNLGFRRFSLRGMRKVKGEFTLMCIGHNLGKLHRLLRDLPVPSLDSLSRAYCVARGALGALRRLLATSVDNPVLLARQAVG